MKTFKNNVFLVLAMSAVFAVISSGCAGTRVSREGAQVELTNEKPQGDCKFLGEAVGSQGNVITGDITSNKELMVGARNDLRNKAADMGGNVVWVQNLSNASAWGSSGTTNTTVVGQVFNCKR